MLYFFFDAIILLLVNIVTLRLKKKLFIPASDTHLLMKFGKLNAWFPGLQKGLLTLDFLPFFHKQA